MVAISGGRIYIKPLSTSTPWWWMPLSTPTPGGYLSRHQPLVDTSVYINPWWTPLSCAVLCQIVSLQYLSRSSLMIIVYRCSLCRLQVSLSCAVLCQIVSLQYLSRSSLMIIVYRCSLCRLQVSLSCAVRCQIVSLQYSSKSSLHRLAGIPCRLFLSYGLKVVTHEVHRSS